MRAPLSRVKKVKDTRFCFDRVFDESATQQQVYDTSARELVPGVFDGYNATVFAYGVGLALLTTEHSELDGNTYAKIMSNRPQAAARRTPYRGLPLSQA
jgi:hypothetical protein